MSTLPIKVIENPVKKLVRQGLTVLGGILIANRLPAEVVQPFINSSADLITGGILIVGGYAWSFFKDFKLKEKLSDLL
jgi:hypothetical protein